MLLERLPIDLVEKIAVCTCSYPDYKSFCEVIKKLKETQIRSRIIGKMMEVAVTPYTICYYIGKY